MDDKLPVYSEGHLPAGNWFPVAKPGQGMYACAVDHAFRVDVAGERPCTMQAGSYIIVARCEGSDPIVGLCIADEFPNRYWSVKAEISEENQRLEDEKARYHYRTEYARRVQRALGLPEISYADNARLDEQIVAIERLKGKFDAVQQPEAFNQLQRAFHAGQAQYGELKAELLAAQVVIQNWRDWHRHLRQDQTSIEQLGLSGG